jgi:hypothetical protein
LFKDYFTQKHWDKIPALWRRSLEDTEPTELAWLLTENR